MKKIINFTKALAKYTMSGFQNVNEEIYDKRMEICASCPLNFKGECALCGCPVINKALWATESCPDKRWNAEIKNQESENVNPENLRDEKKGGNPISKVTSKKGCKSCQKRTK